MSRNQIWTLFLCALTGVVALFSVKTLFEAYQFLSLTESTVAHSVEPEIIKLKNGRYTLRVGFSYEIEGQSYTKTQRLRKKAPFKNRWAAQEAFKEIQQSQHLVWFSKSYPKKSQLDKFFPVKRVCSSAILVGILVYFFLLGKYIFTMD